MADWAAARRADPSLLTEWQVYRMIDVQPAWAAFQYLVRERLREEGAEVAPRRDARLERLGGREGDRGEPLAGTRRLVRARGPTGGSSPRRRSGRAWKRSCAGDAAVLDPEQRPLVELALAQASAGRSARRRSSAVAGGGEEELLPAVPIQSGRPAARAMKRVEAFRSSSQAVAIAPCSSSSASGLPSACSASAKIASESTVMSGWARSKP